MRTFQIVYSNTFVLTLNDDQAKKLLEALEQGKLQAHVDTIQPNARLVEAEWRLAEFSEAK